MILFGRWMASAPVNIVFDKIAGSSEMDALGAGVPVVAVCHLCRIVFNK